MLLMAYRVNTVPIGEPNHPVMALEENFLGFVPVAVLHRTLEIRAMVSI